MTGAGTGGGPPAASLSECTGYGRSWTAAAASAFGSLANRVSVPADGQSLEDVATPLNAGRRGVTRAEGAGTPRQI